MAYRAMLADMVDLLDSDRPVPPVAELIELQREIDKCRHALDHPDRYAAGAPWLARRELDLFKRRTAGKSIRRDDVAEVLAALDAQTEHRVLAHGGDPFADMRAATRATLERIAADCERPRRPKSREWRRRQAACVGLLTATIASPAMARAFGCPFRPGRD